MLLKALSLETFNNFKAIQRLVPSLRNLYQFHSNATKTRQTFWVEVHLKLMTNLELSNALARDAKPLISFITEKMSGPKRSIKITDHFKCTSDDVIYLHNLACTYFIKLYIGGTRRRLGDRFRELLRNLDRNDKDASKPVAKKSSVFLISTFLSFQISIKFHFLPMFCVATVVS